MILQMHIYSRAPKKAWSGGQIVKEDPIQVPNFLRHLGAVHKLRNAISGVLRPPP